MYFILLTLSDTGIGVEPDPFMRGLGLEEQWSAPWSDVMSLELVHQPEPIVRIEFSLERSNRHPGYSYAGRARDTICRLLRRAPG
jgi:hypothetical protein